MFSWSFIVFRTMYTTKCKHFSINFFTVAFPNYFDTTISTYFYLGRYSDLNKIRKHFLGIYLQYSPNPDSCGCTLSRTWNNPETRTSRASNGDKLNFGNNQCYSSQKVETQSIWTDTEVLGDRSVLVAFKFFLGQRNFWSCFYHS